MNDCINVIAKDSKRVKFYKCKGQYAIILAAFTNKKPWNIPLNIEVHNLQQINKLPLTISFSDKKYQLGGCIINTGILFTAIIVWHGRPYVFL